MDEDFWRKCNSCKKAIGFGALYWICNVSTCNRKRTGLVFCSVSCWDAHVPMMNHRESWAEEKRAPKKGESEESSAPRQKPQAEAKPAAPAPVDPSLQAPKVILRKGSGGP
jgi:hypothetical protein